MIFQSDAIIREAIRLGIEDIRKDVWLLDYILNDFTSNIYLKDKYGEKQVQSAKEWFLNNEIEISMVNRKDKEKFPLVSITLGSSSEIEDMKTTADSSTDTEILYPDQIGRPIPYIIKPFTGWSYDNMTGILTITEDLANLPLVTPGMIVVDPATGNGYTVLSILGTGLQLEANLNITANSLGILPQYQFYKARIERSFFNESYTIGCHAHGDPQTVLWLHSIVFFALLRYRESLLEANGFNQSLISSSDMNPNPKYSDPAGDTVFSRYISLTGMVENQWLKAPKRIIETLALREKVNDSFIGGIKIISNLNTAIQDDTDWRTIQGD